MGERETDTLRDQKLAKIAILAQNLTLFGILSVHWILKQVFKLIMSEKMWVWKQTEKLWDSHIKSYKNLAVVSETVKKRLTGHEFGTSSAN